MISTVQFSGRRARKQLYRVAVRVQGQDGEARWEPITGPLSHSKALAVGWRERDVNKREVRLEDFVPGMEAKGTTGGASAAQLELTK